MEIPEGSINQLISVGNLNRATELYRELMNATMTPVSRQFARARIRKKYKEMKKKNLISK